MEMELKTRVLAGFWLLLVVLARSSDSQVDPRGARPVEQQIKSDKCSQKEWPFCYDSDWGPKCPSGCRMQGLLDQADQHLLKKIKKIQELLQENKGKYQSTDQMTKSTYSYLTDKLVSNADSDGSYQEIAERLRLRIVELKIKIDRQLRLLDALKASVKDQVVQMQRLEVDVDIKLRSCKGSCLVYSGDLGVDRQSYAVLDKQLEQLSAPGHQSVELGAGPLHVLKSLPLAAEPSDDGRYKSAGLAFFPGVRAEKLTMETEGSSPSSPATVSKVPGTALGPSGVGGAVGTAPGDSTKSITALGGGAGWGGFDFFDGMGGGAGGTKTTVTSSKTTSHTSCKTTTVYKDGVPTTTQECEGAPPVGGGGGMGAFFPSLTKTSLSTKSEGLGLGSSDPFGLDLGEFEMGRTDDDVPDFHARSVKSGVRRERRADYVGKDCADVRQHHLHGERSGLFPLRPGGGGAGRSGPPGPPVQVFCQQGGLMGGWALVQQRESGAVGFNRSWAEYRAGFGGVDARGRGEVWLGNENLHRLTNGSAESMLRVELEDWEGGVAWAEYTARVGGEGEGYPLRVSGYEGDAGDALIGGRGHFLSHAGMRFSTFDRDADNWEEGSCAGLCGGGWWFNNCRSANLNGVYYGGGGGHYDPGANEMENGVVWLPYRPAGYSLKAVRMLLRPVAF